MNVVAFIVSLRADLGGVTEVVPAVDGVRLTDLVQAFEEQQRFEAGGSAYGGLVPVYFHFGALDEHYRGATLDGKVPLIGCDCGEWGCWPFRARIACGPTVVTWTEFEQPHRRERDYSGLGPFRFDRTQYERALRALMEQLAARAA